MSVVRLLLLLIGLLLSAAVSAETRWEAVAQKIRSAQDYSFHYTFKGAQGRYEFAYASDRAGRVRTEILPGSERGAGTVIVFDPAVPDCVTMSMALGRIRRSIESRDIKGTSLYTSLYGQLLAKLGGAPAGQAQPQGLTMFDFAGRQRVYVNGQLDIVRYEELKDKEQMEFRDIAWNSNPKLDF